MPPTTVRGYSTLPQDLPVSCTNSYRPWTKQNHTTCSNIRNTTFNIFKTQTQVMPLEAPFQPVNSLLRAEQPQSIPLKEQFYFKTYVIHIRAAEETISFHCSCKTPSCNLWQSLSGKHWSTACSPQHAAMAKLQETILWMQKPDPFHRKE